MFLNLELLFSFNCSFSYSLSEPVNINVVILLGSMAITSASRSLACLAHIILLECTATSLFVMTLQHNANATC